MRVRFLGTGNAFNSSAKGNQCLAVEVGDASWWLDCGPTSVLQAARFDVSLDTLQGVCLTHLHGDHGLGLPMLLLHLLYIERRDAPFYVVGPPGTEAYVQAAWKLAYPDVSQRPLSFPLEVIELDGERAETVDLAGVSLETRAMAHTIPVNGYRLRYGPHTLALSGDTGTTPALDALGADADLLVIECSFMEPFGRALHMSVAEHRAGLPYGARQVALIHTGPDVWEQREALAAELGVVFPADGDVIALPT